MMDNSNPIIYKIKVIANSEKLTIAKFYNDNFEQLIDASEIFNYIRNIKDPEYPLTLEQLGVVKLEYIYVNKYSINVKFEPTVPHCSQASIIGLSIVMILYQVLPNYYKVQCSIIEGKHVQDKKTTKQLQDKERVIAAAENKTLYNIIMNSVTDIKLNINDFIIQTDFVNNYNNFGDVSVLY